MAETRKLSARSADGLARKRTRIYEFGPFRFHVDDCLLIENGKRRDLTPTLMHLLLVLVENNGRIVSKEDLMRLVWQDRFVDDGNVNRQVSTLRRLLSDSPQNPGYIETLPRVGYRFLANVREIHEPGVDSGKLRKVVGHLDERRRLRQAFAELRSGKGQLLCVTGEAGLGKTTLVTAFLDDIRYDRRAFLAAGSASERLAGVEPYLPFLEALDSLVVSADSRDNVGSLLAKTAPHWFSQVTTVRSSETGKMERPSMRAGSSERLKREAWHFLNELSAIKPVVLFIDDLHWADVSTIDLLTYITQYSPAPPVLVIVTYRLTEMQTNASAFLQLRQTLTARGICHDLPLSFLAVSDIQEYLDMEFPDRPFPGNFAVTIHARTEGNPLFVVDLLRHLKESGQVRTLTDQDMPPSIRSLIDRELDELQDADRQLLSAASVQGFHFDSFVLAKALGLDEVEVEDQLIRLQKTTPLVTLTGEVEFPNHTIGNRYRWVHILYQNVLFGRLSPSRRTSLSGKIAKALVSLHGENDSAIAGDLAYLFRSARDLARSADYFHRAAQNALRILAHRESVTLARHGIDVVQKLPSGSKRAEREMALHLTEGSGLMVGEGHRAAGPAFERALQACRALPDSRQRCSALVGLWMYHGVRIDPAHVGIAQDLLRTAKRLKDPVLEIGGRFTTGFSLTIGGRFEEARSHLERGISLYDPETHLTHLALYDSDLGIFCYSELARLLWILGETERAEELQETALRMAKATNEPRTMFAALDVATECSELQENPERTKQLAEEMIALSEQWEMNQSQRTYAEIFLAWARFHLDESAESNLTAMEQLIEEVGRTVLLGIPHFMALLAQCCGMAERASEGLEWCEKGLQLIEQHGEHRYEANLHRIHGDLLAQLHRPHEAKWSYQAALRVARNQRAKPWEKLAAGRLRQMQAGAAN